MTGGKKTNEQRYGTPEERVRAFHDFLGKRCGKGICEKCEVRELCSELGYDGKFVGWLALEAEEEKPMPCPFCGGECVEATSCEEYPHVVKCVECGYRTPEYAYKTFADAVAAHNRVARAVKAAREGEAE